MSIEHIWSYSYDIFEDLSQHHLDMLGEDSCISLEIIRKARPFSLKGRFVSESSLRGQILDRLGLPRHYSHDLLIFPYPNHGDTFRVRFDEPEKDKSKKDIRYKQPAKQRNVPYIIAPIVPKSEIICITEGEKKALALASTGYSTIGFGGVWNWRDKSALTGVIPDFEQYDLANIKIAIIFDSDIATNKNVLAAEDAISDFCLDRGASEVRRVRIPVQSGSKLGIDDYFREYRIQNIDDLLCNASVDRGFISGLELKRLDLEPSAMLTQFLPERALSLIAGVPGAGKTEFMIRQAVEAADHGIVLYYLSEGGQFNLQQRLNSYCQDDDVLRNILFECRRSLSFDDPNGFIRFERVLNFYKPKLVVIDPGPDAFGEENDASKLKRPLSELYRLSEQYQCCIVLSWHFSKVPSFTGVYSFRGSSAIAGKMDLIYDITTSENKRYLKLDKLRLDCEGLHQGQKWMLEIDSDGNEKKMRFMDIQEAIEARNEKKQQRVETFLSKFTPGNDYPAPELIHALRESFDGEIKETTAKNYLKRMQTEGKFTLIQKHRGSSPAIYRRLE